MEVKVEEVESMSIDELEKLEDQLESSADQDAVDASSQAESSQAESQAGASGEVAGPEQQEATGTDSDAASTEDLKKHISPPSKWAAERAKRRELKAELERTREKAEKAEQMEKELSELKQKLGWIEKTVQAKGIEVPSGPEEAFSDDRINEIREEYGDELADMMQAAAALLKSNSGPDNDSKASAEDGGHGGDVDDSQELIEAINSNDELSFWQENSPALWKKAVDVDNALLKDPNYLAMPYKDRFAMVVEKVKEDVLGKAKDGGDAGTDQMPESLSGSSGTAPVQAGDSALDRILAAEDPEKQLKIYNSLPESERDKIDQELNI